MHQMFSRMKHHLKTHLHIHIHRKVREDQGVKPLNLLVSLHTYLMCMLNSQDNLWQVKSEGAEKALKLFKTQQEAIDYAKKVAGNQEGYIVIHKKDGSFRKLTY